MINIPMVLCVCNTCKIDVERPASDFDTEEKLTCQYCGADYSTVGLFFKPIEENG